MKKVYLSLSTDIIHNGHIKIINKAAQLGKVTVGVLTDEVVASYKRYPMLSFEERKEIAKNIVGIDNVIEQDTLSYEINLRALKPDYVVHGDDWKEGPQRAIRQNVIDVLSEWGGELVELPYSKDASYEALEQVFKKKLTMPEFRRPRLKKILGYKNFVSVLEAHNGLTGLIVENTSVNINGKLRQFDAIWVSSLCDSTAKGKPDIELVDMSSRIHTIEEIMEVTTKPIILDGDSGGLIEHFEFNIKTLERIGVSAIIIEDKVGLKKNSLFGTEVEQTQDTIEKFSEKIRAGKAALQTKDFMLIARIESLILDKGMEDALQRAFAYVEAGADGIMIHSRKTTPEEIFEFVNLFREKHNNIPIVVVPTTFNTIREDEWKEKGVNIVIHANHLIRSAFPAMQKVAETILANQRSYETNELCMSIKKILTLIPER